MGLAPAVDANPQMPGGQMEATVLILSPHTSPQVPSRSLKPLIAWLGAEGARHSVMVQVFKLSVTQFPRL